MVRKACIEGNCRVHDIETVYDTILMETRPENARPGEYSAKSDDQLRWTMVGGETARKYRAMSSFNSRWTVQFRDLVDLSVPLDRATFRPEDGHEGGEEEVCAHSW